MLSALSAVIEVAGERLYDVDKDLPESSSAKHSTGIYGEEKINDLILLAASLASLGRNEIERLDRERPNEHSAFDDYKRKRDLISIFVDGFDRIAGVLVDLGQKPNDTTARLAARKVVDEVADAVVSWWTEHKIDLVDWSMKIGFMTAGIAFLRMAGAEMQIATPAVAAVVGGEKIIQTISKCKTKKLAPLKKRR